MKNDEFTRTLKAIMKRYGKAYEAVTDKLTKLVFEYMEKGETVTQAYNKAIKQVDFKNLNAEAIEDAVYEATLKGYGVKAEPLFVEVAGEAAIRHKLMDVSWAEDKMNLSTRLHGVNNVLRNNIKSTVNESLKTYKTIKQTAMLLYDGYNVPENVLNQAELPKYLQKIKRLTKKLYSGDIKAARESKLYKAVEHDIRKLKTPALRAAYKQALEASATDKKRAIQKAAKMTKLGASTEEVNDMLLAERQAATQKALWVAAQEKTRYYAERIARTESARAYYEGQLKKAKDNPDIFGFKWVLSSAHVHSESDCDCDEYSKTDLGYGAGVFPKDDVPELPAHPNCMCHLKIVYVWEVETDYVPDDSNIETRLS